MGHSMLDNTNSMMVLLRNNNKEQTKFPQHIYISFILTLINHRYFLDLNYILKSRNKYEHLPPNLPN